MIYEVYEILGLGIPPRSLKYFKWIGIYGGVQGLIERFGTEEADGRKPADAHVITAPKHCVHVIKGKLTTEGIWGPGLRG